MNWMITTSGQDHFLCGLRSPSQVDIMDIAHALSLINRFTGHTIRPYSVAEHSLLVADICAMEGQSPITQLAALLHDAHEAYTGDMSSPVKWEVGHAWRAFEGAHAEMVHRRFGLGTTFRSRVGELTHCDLLALATERRDLTTFQPTVNRPWAVLDTPGCEVRPVGYVCLNTPQRARRAWTDWRDEFLQRFLDLDEQVKSDQAAQRQSGAAA